MFVYLIINKTIYIIFSVLYWQTSFEYAYCMAMITNQKNLSVIFFPKRNSNSRLICLLIVKKRLRKFQSLDNSPYTVESRQKKTLKFNGGWGLI